MDPSSKCQCINFRLFDQGSSTNDLINQKMLLYSWIRPEHLELEIDHAQTEDALKRLRAIPESTTPTDKILCVMEGVEALYGSIGCTRGQDDMLPSLIYCLIKTGEANMYLEIQFMTLYKRESVGGCRAGCLHGLGIEVECSCLQRKQYDEKEVAYYLTSLQAAMDFIKKMEYYDLKISKAEFDQNIENSIQALR